LSAEKSPRGANKNQDWELLLIRLSLLYQWRVMDTPKFKNAASRVPFKSEDIFCRNTHWENHYRFGKFQAIFVQKNFYLYLITPASILQPAQQKTKMIVESWDVFYKMSACW